MSDTEIVTKAALEDMREGACVCTSTADMFIFIKTLAGNSEVVQNYRKFVGRNMDVVVEHSGDGYLASLCSAGALGLLQQYEVRIVSAEGEDGLYLMGIHKGDSNTAVGVCSIKMKPADNLYGCEIISLV